MIDPAIEEQYFLEVADEWNLEPLYQKLANIKQINISRKAKLSSVEKAMLRGLLTGHSPKKIAAELHWTSASVGVELSKGIYRYVEVLTDREPNSLSSWRDIAKWLEEAGYKTKVKAHQVWVSKEELPEVPQFYGREEELNQLQKWIVSDRYRLVLLSGMIGMGKTTLAARLTHKIKPDFEYIIWRDLQYQSSLSSILVEILASFAPNKNHNDLAMDLNAQITQLIKYLKQYRCLLIFDGLESVMSANSFAGFYSTEHQAYNQLTKRIAVENHQSCLLITSREEPVDMPLLQNNKADLFNLKGLEKDGYKIFNDYNLSFSQLSLSACDRLLDDYSGNPLALKLIASIIKDLFNGDIFHFFNARDRQEIDIIPLYFKKIFEAQLKRLSSLEREILYHLASNSQPICIDYLQKKLSFKKQEFNFVTALNSLKRRSFLNVITKNNKICFSVHSIIKKHLVHQSQDNYNLLAI